MSKNDPTTQAEQIVLGTAMIAPHTVAELSILVSADDFYTPAHVTIWQAILDQHTDGAPTEPTAVAVALKAGKQLSKVGGAPYLVTLVGTVPTAANGGYYARLVAEAAQRRRVAAAGVRLAQVADNPDVDVATLMAEARDDLSNHGPAVWPEPIPLTTAHNPPQFPAAVLPDWLGDMVTATATSTQTPTDLAGSIGLACLSAATMGRASVEIKSGWVEQTNLFTCVALGPGNRKSSVFDALTRPIRQAEAALVEELRPKVIEARTEKAISVKAAEKALAVASNADGDPDAVNNAKTAAREAEALVVPVEPVLIADDATPESAKTLLAEQGGRLAVMSAEGGIFATIAGRYSGVPDLDVFLKGHAGDMLRVTRKSAPMEHIERPVLTFGLAVQPSVLRDIGSIPGFEDRGLLARFLFSLPTSTVGYRDPSPDAIPNQVREIYTRRMRELTEIMWHATDTTLTLTPEAFARVKALEAMREPKLRAGGEWEPILNWANKLTGTIVRIAGLLHIADNLATGWRTPITADTIDAAAHIGNYYAHHALAVWDHMGTDTTGPAHRVLAWLQQQRQTTWSRREIHRALCRRLSIAELDAGLRVLSDHGHVRIHQPRGSGRGRRPAPQVHVHPHHTGGAQ